MNNYYERVVYPCTAGFSLCENRALSDTPPAMHYHNVIEIGIAEKGSGTFIINGEINYFNRGDVSVIFPNDIHISSSNTNDKSVWTYILIDITMLIKENPHLFSMIGKKLYDGVVPSLIFSEKTEPVLKLAARLKKELKEKAEGYIQVSAAISAEILTEIMRKYKTSRKNHDLYQKISPAIAYIMSKYDEDITVNTLAAECFLSETHFRRIFKKATGFSPLDYIYRIRISSAMSLLKAKTMTVMHICTAVGYTSQTSFNKHFKRYTGTTPSGYARSVRGG